MLSEREKSHRQSRRESQLDSWWDSYENPTLEVVERAATSPGMGHTGVLYTIFRVHRKTPTPTFRVGRIRNRRLELPFDWSSGALHKGNEAMIYQLDALRITLVPVSDVTFAPTLFPFVIL